VDGIPKYSNMLKEAQSKFTCTNLLMSNEQHLAIASTTVLALEHYLCPTNDWETHPQDQKTWPA
jgi:hypothetical protein